MYKYERRGRGENIARGIVEGLSVLKQEGRAGSLLRNFVRGLGD